MKTSRDWGRGVPFWFAVLVVVLAACGGGDGAGEEAASATDVEPTTTAAFDATTAGSLVGVVGFENGDDPDAVIRMDADPVCQGLHAERVYSQTRVGDAEGHLANAFVYVKSGLEGYSFPAPSEPVVLEQRGCIYRPHVTGLVVGQTLKVVNNDPTLHNVHALPKSNPEFNQGQPFQGMELEKTFKNVEVMIPFKCDVHPWMSSYMAVLEHPYFAVSGEDGSFAIDGLPPGEYTIEAWHEVFGTQTEQITVGEKETVELSITFKPTA